MPSLFHSSPLAFTSFNLLRTPVGTYTLKHISTIKQHRCTFFLLKILPRKNNFDLKKTTKAPLDKQIVQIKVKQQKEQNYTISTLKGPCSNLKNQSINKDTPNQENGMVCERCKVYVYVRCMNGNIFVYFFFFFSFNNS